MPHIVDELGNQPNTQVERADMPLDQSIAWTMDPFAPVPENFQHLVNNPNEGNTDPQEEQQ